MAKVNMAGPAGSIKVEEKDVQSYKSRGYVVTDKPKEESKVEDKTKTKKISKLRTPKLPSEKKPADDK